MLYYEDFPKRTPMPTDPVKIPQNVQIEDRVVGPLSLRQIIIMAVGGGFSYMVYAGVQKSMGYVGIPLTIIIWIPAAIAAAFAVVNINDLSLLRICLLLLERTQKPRVRTWATRPGISVTIRTSRFKTEEDAPKTAPATVRKPNAQEQITALSSVLDQASLQPKDTADVSAPAETSLPVQTTTMQQPAAANTSPAAVAEIADAPKPTPVRPESIHVDLPRPALGKPKLSDLSVFRDIFPPTAQWQA